MGDNNIEPVDISRLYVESFCSVCGRLLFIHEIRANIDGEFIDYVNRTQGSARLIVCDECWETLVGFTEQDIDGARRRYLEDHECHATDAKTENGD